MRTLLLLLLVVQIPQAFASDKFYGKGYTIVDEMTPTDDLSQSVYRNIKAYSVEEGLTQLLKGTGWRLANRFAAEPEIYRLYQQPFPDNKKNIGPMPLDKALVWVGGNAWQLVVDPVNKLISFELSQGYTCFPSTKKLCPVK
ncbi:MAG: hypothetical protein KGV56_02745 [Gammaproteobacteria bacterium]|nr:hypothetical protein [Gammaproteobacteria bacterium]